MITIPLRQLVREPLKVKRWTRGGQSVQVTDNGKPLWIIHSAITEEGEEGRICAIDEVLDEVLEKKHPSKTSLSEIVLESRR